MKIEVLFPEFGNLNADLQNMEYLKRCLEEAEFIYTSAKEEVRFVKEDIDLVYLGCMTERQQEVVIEKLMPHKDIIKKQIDDGKVFLATGNAMEIFGQYIEKDNGDKIQALGIFETYAKRQMMKRYADLCSGKFDNMEILGFKATFSFSYNDQNVEPFMNVEVGVGNNMKSKKEGIRKNNFYGTYLVGPILILNPDFTKYLINILGVKNPKLAFEEEMYETYNARLLDFINYQKKQK